jgi:hypothetical protein
MSEDREVMEGVDVGKPVLVRVALTVKDRAVLSMLLLPESGRWTEYQRIRVLRERFALSEAEEAQTVFLNEERTRWENDFSRYFSFTKSEIAIIKRVLAKTEAQGGVNADNEGLFLKFDAIPAFPEG